MQNFNENEGQFSSPCVDNSLKNGEKIASNNGVLPKNGENTPKSANFTENIDTSSGFWSNFNDNSGVLSVNTEIQSNSVDFSIQNKEFQAITDDFANNNDINRGISENNEKNADSSTLLTFEDVIERDFKDFALIYPNVSKKSLLESENLKIFAEGKENKPFSVTYARYSKFVNNIASEAVLQEKSRQANKSSATGPLAGNQNANTPFFTREQVKNMTPSEIKMNYDIIRKSQSNW